MSVKCPNCNREMADLQLKSTEGLGYDAYKCPNCKENYLIKKE